MKKQNQHHRGHGGSYSKDPKTGKLTLISQTKQQVISSNNIAKNGSNLPKGK